MLGNKVGRKSGRNKLVVFGLRPRHTANVVTAFTGGTIAVVTLLISLALSGQMAVLSGRLADMESRYQQALREYEELRRGRLAFQANEVLAVEVVEPGLPADRLRALLSSVLGGAEATARQRWFAVLARDGEAAGDQARPVLRLDPTVSANLVALLSRASTAQAIEVRIAENVRLGQEPMEVPVTLGARPVRLLYRQGDRLGRTTLTPDDPDLATRLNDFVYTDLARAAADQGMRANPITGQVDVSVGTAATLTLADWLPPLLGALRAHRGPVEVEARAAHDLYDVGRLDVDLVSPTLDLRLPES